MSQQKCSYFLKGRTDYLLHVRLPGAVPRVQSSRSGKLTFRAEGMNTSDSENGFLL